MLMQVLRLTPEQLNQLPPKEREQILQLVRRLLRLLSPDRRTDDGRV